mgnify:CR=1 FL=1
MKLIDLQNINFPNKNDERYRGVNLKALLNQEFKQTKAYQVDIKSLDEKLDSVKYDDFLFDVTKVVTTKQSVLEIKENTNKPIVIYHRLCSDDTLFANSLEIIVKKGVIASIIEVFESDGYNSADTINRNIICAQDAKLEYVKIQDIRADNTLIFNCEFTQYANSRVDVYNFDYGDGLVLNTFNNTFNHKKAIYNLYGLVKLNHKANCSNLIHTLHQEEDCVSNIDFKHSLDDKSKAVFKANSRVENEAKNSKAFQNANTILLSDDATILAEPHLQIFVDELEASHGTTTGSLDEEQLLYLQMRGISKQKATMILLDAFEKEIYNSIQDQNIKNFIDEFKG